METTEIQNKVNLDARLLKEVGRLCSHFSSVEVNKKLSIAKINAIMTKGDRTSYFSTEILQRVVIPHQ